MITMSDWGKRLGAVCISALAAAAVLMGNAPKVPAEEYRGTDPYVLIGELRENGMVELTGADTSALAYPLGENQPLPAGQRYRRLNLEDGEMMDAVRAGKIRAVILAVQDLQELGRAVGEDSLMNLTEGEAVAAAREAILLHVSGDTPDGDCSALTRYLWALPPVVGETVMVSDNSLHIRSAAAKLQPDGTYRVEVEFTTTVSCCPEDGLTVTVFCGTLHRSFPLTEENREAVHRVEFSCGEAPAEVRVEINGCQQGAGVFLFAPSGDPGAAPLLAGFDRSRMRVHAEATAAVAGELVLDIYTGAPGEVEIYRVAELWELLSGAVTLDTAHPNGYKRDENRVATLTTDDGDNVSFHLSRAGYTEGVYLISGQDAAVEDTFVCVPAADGEGWQYRVTVEPERGLYLIWWIALICGLLTGTVVAAALVIRLRGK